MPKLKTIKLGWWGGAFVALGLSAGCATRVAGLKQSEAFRYPTIVVGKMAVGGVTSVVEELPEGKRNSLGNLLRTQLLEERKDFPVIPPGNLIGKIGTDKYHQLMAGYKETGVLTDEWFRLLKEKVGTSTRFVAFARIENDDVNQDRREVERTNGRGQVIPGEGSVVTTATRTITASLAIYDLQLGDVAWSGQVTKSLQNTHQFEKEKEIGLVSVIKAIKGTEGETAESRYPFPSAPDSNKVLAHVFAGFAENMPKKD